MHRLTARQELFCQAIFSGMGQAEAYKWAGYKVYKHPKQGGANSSRLIGHDRIKARLAEMELERELSGRVTAQTVTKMLADTYRAATKDRQHGAAATAAMGIAKLHGLLVDRIEDVTRKPARSPDAPLQIEVDAWLNEHAQALDAVPSLDAADGLPTLDLEPRLAGQVNDLPEEKILKSGCQDHQNIHFGSETIGGSGLGPEALPTEPQTVIVHNGDSPEPKGSGLGQTVMTDDKGQGSKGSEP